jgi:glycosidase
VQDDLYQLNKHFGRDKDLIDFINEAHKYDIYLLDKIVFEDVSLSYIENMYCHVLIIINYL